MGRNTTVYGYIQEFPGRPKFSEHNQIVLERLPLTSDHPVLNKAMFYTAKGDTATNQVSHFGRMILLGGSFRAMEDKWDEWIFKFEELLTQLIWIEAKIHIVTDWFPEKVCEWNINLGVFDEFKLRNPPYSPLTKNDWKFKGPRNFDSLAQK